MQTVRAQLRQPVRFSVVLMMMVGYLFLALLVVEQNHVIQSQRTLIRALFGDSTLLAHLQVKEARDRAAAAKK